MIRVTRYLEGDISFHTCKTPAPVHLSTGASGLITVDMPWRYWTMCPGGKIVIEFSE